MDISIQQKMRQAGKVLTGARDFYEQNRSVILGWGSFVPAVAFAATHTQSPYAFLWGSIAAAGFSLFASDCAHKLQLRQFEREQNMSPLGRHLPAKPITLPSLGMGLAGGVVGVVAGGAIAAAVYAGIEKPDVGYQVQDNLEKSCWIASDDVTFNISGHSVRVQPTRLITVTSQTTILTADGKTSEEVNTPTYRGEFNVSWSAKNFFNRNTTDFTEKFYTQIRPGPYDAKKATQNCLRLDR